MVLSLVSSKPASGLLLLHMWRLASCPGTHRLMWPVSMTSPFVSRLVCDWRLTFAFHGCGCGTHADAVARMPSSANVHARQTSGPERCRRKGICVRWRPSHQGSRRVDKARWQATRRSDADSMAARKTLKLGRLNSAHPCGLLCECGGLLRCACSS